MEILEYGHIKPVEVKCQNCGAKYAYTPIDIGYQWHRPFVTCPVCGRGTRIKNEEAK